MDILVVLLFHIWAVEGLDHNLLVVDKDFVAVDKGLTVEDKDLVVADNFVEV